MTDLYCMMCPCNNWDEGYEEKAAQRVSERWTRPGCELTYSEKRSIGRGKGRKMFMWEGRNGETKGWTEREGKEGVKSERDGA